MIAGRSYPVAWVDLSRNSVLIEEIAEDVLIQYIGGKGLAAHILYRHLPARTDPLGPQNLVALLTGPLTGTAFPASSRSVLAFKSPLTHTFSDSYCGGRLGPYLRRSGLGGLVVTGRAAGPVYLLVQRGRVSIRKADHLWGLTTGEAAERLKNEVEAEKCGVAAIGPAGENLSALANVVNEGRFYGRGGPGAVWGAKNLKALVACDGDGVAPEDGPGFKAMVRQVRKRLGHNPLTRPGGPWNTVGTMMTVTATQQTGTLPTLNWRENAFDRADAVKAEAFLPLVTGAKACYGCPIACGREVEVSLEGDRRTTEAPEYETIYAFGPNCGVDDPEVIIAANELCAQYGLDTISTGVALSFAMECRQRGLWPDGPDIHFGDGPALLEAIESLARRRPGYRELADGVRKAARAVPGGSELAIEVKGLELPGYDPRGMKGQALCYALADRGGCHLRSSTLGPELLGHPEGYDRLEYNGKAELIARMQLDKILFNTLPVCLFAGAEIKIEDGLAAAVAMTGRGLTYDQLRQTAERIRTLIRMFNAREGLDRRRDTLPQRLFDQPSTHGPSRGETVDRDKFEQLLTEYYRLVGWDPDTGLPTDETKARLGLNHAF